MNGFLIKPDENASFDYAPDDRVNYELRITNGGEIFIYDTHINPSFNQLRIEAGMLIKKSTNQL